MIEKLTLCGYGPDEAAVYRSLNALYAEKYAYLTDGAGDGGAAAEVVRQLGRKMDRFGGAGDLLWITAGERAGRHLFAPVVLTLILTLECNAGCPICFVKPRDGRRYPHMELETREVMDIMGQAANLGVDRIRLFGGEALLREDIMDIIEYGCSLNIGLALFTNGVRLSAWHAADTLASAVDGYPYFYVQVSIDGLGRSHEAQRPGARVEDVKRAIVNLREAGIPFSTNTVLSRGNIDEVEAIVAFSHENGAENIIFNTIKLCGGGSRLEKNRLTPREVRGLGPRIDGLKERYPDQEIYLNIQDTIVRAKLMEATGLYPKKLAPRDGEKAHNCLAYTYSMAIAPDGSVLPCEFFAPFTEYWGESVVDKGIKWAWDRSRMSHFMRHLPIKGKCAGCEYRESCDMGCPVENMMVTGSFDAPDPFCWYVPGRPDSADEIPDSFDFIHGHHHKGE